MALEELVSRIRGAQAPLGLATRVIGIDGCGGAGKSTLAAAVARELGGAPIVHTDDFASWEVPIDRWPRLIDQVLEPLARGERPRYQRYDWDSRQLAEWIDVPASEFLILEGVSATRLAFTRYLAFSVWVETPAELRFQRGIERDGPGMADQWRQWMAAEDAYIDRERPPERANLIVSGVGPLA